MNQESRIMGIKNIIKSIIHNSLFPSTLSSGPKGMIRKSKGFTLIELLVAISIIGVLSAFLMANFIGVRQRARDGIRKSDLRQIQSALELYRSDQGNYPLSLTACGARFEFGNPAVTYMQEIPCDLLNSGQHIYRYSSDGNTYSLYACLENINDSQKEISNNAAYCNGSTNWSYKLLNP